jgi:hypothetical protein
LSARYDWQRPQNRSFWDWFGGLSRPAQITIGDPETQ